MGSNTTLTHAYVLIIVNLLLSLCHPHWWFPFLSPQTPCSNFLFCYSDNGIMGTWAYFSLQATSSPPWREIRTETQPEAETTEDHCLQAHSVAHSQAHA